MLLPSMHEILVPSIPVHDYDLKIQSSGIIEPGNDKGIQDSMGCNNDNLGISPNYPAASKWWVHQLIAFIYSLTWFCLSLLLQS